MFSFELLKELRLLFFKKQFENLLFLLFFNIYKNSSTNEFQN